MNDKTIGDGTLNTIKSFQNFDSIQLINDDNYKERGINQLIDEKENEEVRETNKDVTSETDKNSLLLENFLTDAINAAPSSLATSSYKDHTPGKYKKLEKPIQGTPYRFESDGEGQSKNGRTSRIMGSIQLGIHHTIGGLASKPDRDLLMKDFMEVESTTFAADGSNRTPAHSYSQFVFKTYAPIAFRYFRELFGIPPEDYLLSFCKNPLNELSTCGSSGSIFYVTDDDKFIMKTIQKRECEFLQKLLPGYYMNLHQNPKTLLPKFFGLYCYKCETKRIRFVAMNNLLPSHMKLHQKYDIKGSTYKRKMMKKLKTECETPTYKDLDFIYHYQEGLFLEDEMYQEVMKTIQRDCRVLESFKIMDYSLLLGIHILDKEVTSISYGEGQHINDNTGDKFELNSMETINLDISDKDSINLRYYNENSHILFPLQGGIPAKTSNGDKLLIFIGIIDILQSYRLVKKIEHSWKSILHNGNTVSVHNPAFYSQRFQKFIFDKVFKKLPSPAKGRNRVGKNKTLQSPTSN